MATKLKIALVTQDKYTYQYEVAQEAGIHEVRFSRLVSGREKPNDREKRKLSEILGISANKLFPKAA